MQTVLVVQSSVPGAVYLNGRMAGEADADRPLTLPVSPFGALILELRPFLPGYLPLSLRVPLSHGAPLIMRPDPRLCAALWPGGVLEMELLPEPLPSSASSRLIAQAGGIRISLVDSPSPAVRCESASAVHTHPLPEGALSPAVTPLPEGLLVSGDLPSGENYALVLSPDASSLLLSRTGRSLALLNGGAALRLLHAYGDTVGHAALETWAVSPQGWQLVHSESMWESGAPRWPESPEDTAIAAIEAAQLGLMNEAAAFFAPACPCEESLNQTAAFDGCIPLRYPTPGGESAVGLMQLKDNVLHIVPARYAAVPGGTHGGWQLTRLEVIRNP